MWGGLGKKQVEIAAIEFPGGCAGERIHKDRERRHTPWTHEPRRWLAPMPGVNHGAAGRPGDLLTNYVRPLVNACTMSQLGIP